jgi:hypothetical protein
MRNICSEIRVCFHARCVNNQTHVCTSVKRFASDVVGPKVREMDENESMDPSIIKGLFEQGVGYFCLPDLNLTLGVRD